MAQIELLKTSGGQGNGRKRSFEYRLYCKEFKAATEPTSINSASSRHWHHWLESTSITGILRFRKASPIAITCSLPASKRLRWVEQSSSWKLAGSPVQERSHNAKTQHRSFHRPALALFYPLSLAWVAWLIAKLGGMVWLSQSESTRFSDHVPRFTAV